VCREKAISYYFVCQLLSFYRFFQTLEPDSVSEKVLPTARITAENHAMWQVSDSRLFFNVLKNNNLQFSFNPPSV